MPEVRIQGGTLPFWYRYGKGRLRTFYHWCITCRVKGHEVRELPVTMGADRELIIVLPICKRCYRMVDR
jgi:hypothetical protein